MIVQNKINVQGELANKTDNHTVSYKHPTGRILNTNFKHELNNDTCRIIPYPTVQEKHIWQVHVTNELKIKLLYFFTIRAIIQNFIAVKNIYLNLSAVLKFATN